MLKQLNRKNIPGSESRPVKVIQFGEGNFLRAFADWIIDILNEKTDFNGAVTIVQPLPNGMGTALNKQDGLYHVVLNGIRNGALVRETRLIQCVKEVINPYTDTAAFLSAAENEHLRFIISNTTEAGIIFSDKDTDPGALPSTFPGKLTSFLYRRFQFFNGSPERGLIFLPCELIDRNGFNLRDTILRYIQHWQLPDTFRSWIESHNIFCNTLVDRIVPGFPVDAITEIRSEIGFDDKLVVKAEPFHLWVIEAPESVSREFPVDKASLEVKFVDDLTPYRTRKVRILNGAHTAMVPIAYLKGLRTVQEMVEDTFTGDLLRRLVFEEIIPTLDLPQEELKSFADDVLERFRNPFIRHELISIALNSVSKFKVRVLPSLLTYRKRKGELPSLLVTSLASLMVFYRGEYNGIAIPLNDSPEILSFFSAAWKNPDSTATVRTILANVALWDQDLTQVDGLEKAVADEVKRLLPVDQGVATR
jgi:tagaturonate reductase